jgi:large subunit ribosomal protein L18
MDQQKTKEVQRQRRRRHVRTRILGTADRPRLSVHRSNKHIYAQLIDDERGITLGSASTLVPDLRASTTYGGNKKAAAMVGKKIAEVASTKGIKQVAFDRGHYRYHGRVKALADAAREGGLKF